MTFIPFCLLFPGVFFTKIQIKLRIQKEKENILMVMAESSG